MARFPVVPLLFLPLCVGCLGAQPLLLREPAGPVRIQHPFGEMPVQLAAVEPDPGTTLLLYADTLRAEDAASVRKFVSDVQAKAPKGQSLAVALVTGDGVSTLGPFKTAAQLNRALAEITGAFARDTSSLTPARFYDSLPGALRTLYGDTEQNWPSLKVVANFPALSSDVEEFAAVVWSRVLRSRHVRATFWSPSGTIPTAFEQVNALTGGGEGPLHVGTYVESTPLKTGFVLGKAKLYVGDMEPVSVGWLSVASGFSLPSVETYAEFRKLRSAALAGESDASAALALNPRDAELLRLAANAFTGRKEWTRASESLEGLAELEPDNGSLQAELGHVLFLSGRMDAAEARLQRALALKSESPQVHEELARILHMSARDAAAAVHFDAALKGNGTQLLWFLAADSALKAGDWKRVADLTEGGLQLGGDVLDRRTRLIELLLSHAPGDSTTQQRALRLVRAAASSLPSDASVRSRYARFFEQLGERVEAVAAWKRTLEVDPKHVEGYERAARLLIEIGRTADALNLANDGIAAIPSSVSLRVSKSEALEKQGQHYAARETLRGAVAITSDTELLRRFAIAEDRYGRGAPAYRLLASKLDPAAPDIKQVLERGRLLAVREQDDESAEWFTERLGDRVNTAGAAAKDGVEIPGGLSALAFVAGGKSAPQERFWAEYCRYVGSTLTERTEKEIKERLSDKVSDYLLRVRTLAGTSRREGDTVKIALDASDKAGQKRTEKLLETLGWRMKTSKAGIVVEPFTKGGKAERQEFASALAVDEVGMQDALKAGKPFQFDLHFERAPMVGGEAVWTSTLLGKQSLPGAIAEALVQNPSAARAYAGLSDMGPGAAEVVLKEFTLKKLIEDYHQLLFAYGSALAIRGGTALIPGGSNAAPAWARVVGVPPSQAAPFFRALLTKDNGHTLNYFYSLSQLDPARQAFFTRSPERLERFYKFYLDSPTAKVTPGILTTQTGIFDFLRGIPLTKEGNIEFPGSPEVWMVAKGSSNSLGSSAKVARKLKKAAAPDLEDEIILRLGRTRYKEKETTRTELENFLAVCRLDAARATPLTEDEALFLAQHFTQFEGAWSYLTVLTGLGKAEYEKLFQLYQRLAELKGVEQNLQAGAVQSYLGLLTLLSKNQALDGVTAAKLFGSAFDRVLAARSASTLTRSWLASLRELTGAIARPGEPADEAFVRSLAHAPESLVFEYNGRPVELHPLSVRITRFKKVLALQKAPQINTLLAFDDSCNALSSTTDPTALAAAVKKLQGALAELPTITVSKEMRGSGKAKEQLTEQLADRLPRAIAEVQQRSTKAKLQSKDLAGPVDNVLEELRPQLLLAMSGLIYGYYLSPDDLVVSEDPLLLRKHRFTTLEEDLQELGPLQASDFKPVSTGTGSYFTGGFATFSHSAAKAATNGGNVAGLGGAEYAVAEIASIRNADWWNLRNEELEVFGLLVRTGREWVLAAAEKPEVRAALDEAATGMVAPGRRASLIRALETAQSRTALQALTVSDLYFLGRMYAEGEAKVKWDSAVTRALPEAMKAADLQKLHVLGPSVPSVTQSDQPSLIPLAPYEEFARFLMPVPLAQRSAECKLQLAYLSDRAGMPAAVLPAVAETLTLAALKKMTLSSPHDWQGAHSACASITEANFEEALGLK